MAAIQSSIFGTFCIRLIGIWAIVHGILTCLGGIAKWTSPAYDVVKLIPGSPYTWGIILCVGGMFTLSASLLGVEYERIILGRKITYFGLKNFGLWVIAAVSLFFAIGVIAVAFEPGSPVSFAAADRDLFICAMSVMMTKAIEPIYEKTK